MADAIQIVSYDPEWPRAFAAERDRIAAVLGPLARRIDHNGSTSVPGLAAKPIIDIQVSVNRLQAIETFAAGLSQLGYVHVPHPTMPSACSSTGRRRGHTATTCTSWKRADSRSGGPWRFATICATTRSRRVNTRRSSAAWRHDTAPAISRSRQAYTEAKTAFVTGVTERALARDILAGSEPTRTDSVGRPPASRQGVGLWQVSVLPSHRSDVAIASARAKRSSFPFMFDSACSPLPSDTGAAAVPLRPPLKWAGGKRWQVPHLRELWEPHRQRRLVEPFCGGMAVTLALMPQTALLNDVSPHVINVYRWLKRGLTITLPMKNEAETYYAYRGRFNALLQSGGGESAEAAALFLYLNRTGYNGLCRFNKRGGFNVPFGRYKKLRYRTDFSEHQAVFERFDFSNADFADLRLDPDDFVYADPPYDVEFTQYSTGGFDWAAQQRAADGWRAIPVRSCCRISGPIASWRCIESSDSPLSR